MHTSGGRGHFWHIFGQSLGSFKFWRWSLRKVSEICSWSIHRGLSCNGVWGDHGSDFENSKIDVFSTFF